MAELGSGCFGVGFPLGPLGVTPLLAENVWCLWCPQAWSEDHRGHGHFTPIYGLGTRAVWGERVASTPQHSLSPKTSTEAAGVPDPLSAAVSGSVALGILQ